MTGGEVVILGEVGNNFGAGMTGGMAFVYDKAGNFKDRVNPATLEIVRISSAYWADKLRSLVEEHAKQTESALASRLLNEWDAEIGNFWQVVPTEIIPTLDKPIDDGQPLEQIA
jgi:glutamate synthase (NADPH/NADH) large chain